MTDSFSLDIAKFTKKFGIDAEAAARKIALDIQRDVMKATPVDTGMLRASWFLLVGASPTGLPASPDGGAAAIAAAVRSLASFKWGDSIYLTNNQVYAVAIEFGHSKQAPAGMLRITAGRYQRRFGRTS